MEAKFVGLRAALDRNRLQQKHLAEALGVSRMTVLEWAAGRTTPSGSNLLRIVAFLQGYEPAITAADLFSADGLVAPEPAAAK